MEKITYQLYQEFYQPAKNTPESRRIEQNHRTLIGRLGKAERNLVLRIIDDKDMLIEHSSYNAFTCGFRLAMRLATEINEKDGQSTEANSAE